MTDKISEAFIQWNNAHQVAHNFDDDSYHVHVKLTGDAYRTICQVLQSGTPQARGKIAEAIEYAGSYVDEFCAAYTCAEDQKLGAAIKTLIRAAETAAGAAEDKT